MHLVDMDPLGNKKSFMPFSLLYLLEKLGMQQVDGMLSNKMVVSSGHVKLIA